MKAIFILILIVGSGKAFGQSIQSITDKVSEKICDCMSAESRDYAAMKSEFNRCYDKAFDRIFSISDSAENKLLAQPGSLEKVEKGVVRALNESCKYVRTIAQSELQNTIEKASNHTTTPCPTNFTGSDVKEIAKLDGAIVAFDGLITEVHTAHKDKPYYQVQLVGGHTIWIGSLVNSGFEEVGKIVRILGYVSKVGQDAMAKKYNKTGYHILAFCIIDIASKQMAALPGAELQVKEWINGKVPKAER